MWLMPRAYGCTMIRHERLHNLLCLRRKIDEEIQFVLRAACGERQYLSVSWPVWPCLDSPVGVCVYDLLDDPHREKCLYCALPESRP